MCSLSIVLPVYNESKNIMGVVSNILSNLPIEIHDFQILIVDDGSTDGTSEILFRLKSSYSSVQVITNRKNYGYGFAVKTGIKYCDRKYIFIMDADRQFRMEDFVKFWINRNQYDFILGYRKKRRDSAYRFALGKVGNILGNLLLMKRIVDINCGFKLFKKDDLQGLHLISEGATIYFEILYDLLKKAQYNILQLPVNHYKRVKGKQTGGNLSVVIKILSETIITVFLKHRNLYRKFSSKNM